MTRRPFRKRGGKPRASPRKSGHSPQHKRGDRDHRHSAAREEIVGRIQFRAGGSAFVVPEGARNPYRTSVQVAADETGVALPGDRVAVAPHPGVRGRRPGEAVGRVVRVVERTRDVMVGELRRSGRRFIVAADDPRFVQDVLVADPARSGIQPVPEPGDKVVVRLDAWTSRNHPLTGTIASRLGRTFEPGAELAGILAKYGLDPAFPDSVRHEVASLPDSVPQDQTRGRRDFRKVPVLTIDPDDAKDFDDALSIENLPDGSTRIGIHIADVSAYVKPGTALDREARRRGNSTYLVGSVIPMLPEKLSNGLCSLVEGEDRLCKAVFLTFNSNGRIAGTEFAETVICSRKRLTYRQAYGLLFEDDLHKVRAMPLPPKHQTGSTGRALNTLSERELGDLQRWVRQLWSIARGLRSARFAHGSLDLDMPETKIFVDQHGYADRLELIENDESHQLIEEFMLAANEAVARLTRTRRLPSLYRVHDSPDEDRLTEFREVLATHGVRVGDLSQRSELVRLLERLRSHPQGHTLRTQLLRSLKKAAYRETADGHFGLHKRDYSHFTSPIRRYADLVVHRVLAHHLQSSRKQQTRVRPPSGAEVGSLGEHLTLTEINSAEAERESVKVKLVEFFERETTRKPRTKFTAVITEVRPNGCFIELVESMAFGFMPASALDDDYYVFSHSGDALVGRRHHRRFAANHRLDVVVHAVDRYKRTIDFRPA
jgi:ribonuclease R